MSVPSVDAAITFLYVADLERSAQFYEKGAGLRLVVDQGDCRIYRLTGSAYLGLCRRDDFAVSAGVIVTLVTSSVDEMFDRLVAAGASVEKPPAANPRYAIYNGFVRDPDGWRIEIQSFDDPRWDEAD